MLSEAAAEGEPSKPVADAPEVASTAPAAATEGPNEEDDRAAGGGRGSSGPSVLEQKMKAAGAGQTRPSFAERKARATSTCMNMLVIFILFEPLC